MRAEFIIAILIARLNQYNYDYTNCDYTGNS